MSSPFDAAQTLVYIRELYEIEHEAKNQTLSPEDCKLLRAEKSCPILDDFHAWLLSMQNTPAALPKSPLGKAIGYALNQWTDLTRFLENGEIGLDNNLVENSLRDVSLGRKNWLFVGSQRGGQATAIIYSIILSARRHNLDLWLYLSDILPRLADLKPGELEQLLPNVWQPSRH